MTEDFLLEIGFTKNESKVYFSLLKKGLSTTSEISSNTSIHRTNVYDCLERLIEKGLVNYIHKERKKYYQASNPNKIKDILNEKERKFQEILPTMLNFKKNIPQNELAEIHRGMKAVRMILYEFLRKKNQILVYGIPKIALTLMEDFILLYHKKRIKRKIIMKHIYDENATKRINQLNKMQYTYARYLPKMKNSPVSTNVCGDEIVFILWGENPYIIQIKNKQIANSYKNYFDLLWKISKN
jgi:sugar-specific transcriptional regulator TrmB